MAAALAGVDRGLWAAMALTLPALEPLLRPGVGYMADVAVHVYRTVELLRLWQEGIAYSRWAPDLAFGLGYPLFNFYPPLFYYLAGGLTLPGLDVEAAVKATVALVLLASAAGAYGLARQWLGESGAMLAAVAYAWSPFRLREAYFQGDYAQLLALALPPIVLWAIHRLAASGKDRYFAATAVACAGLFLSHNISAMLFSPVIAAYIALLALARPSMRRGLPRAIAALLAGAGLSAFFWYPALSEMHLVRVEVLHSGDFDFRRHFPPPLDLVLPSLPLDVNAVNPHVPYNLGLAHLVLALPALWLLANRRLRWAVLAAAAGLAGSAFMMLPTSTPVWQAVPLLPFAEFPWRWLGVAALPLAFLVGAAAEALPRGRALYAAAAAIAIALSLFPHLYPREPFARYDNATVADVVAYEVQEGVVGTTSAGEYLPKGVKPTPIPALLAAYAEGRTPERLDRSTLPPAATAEALARPLLGGTWRVSSATAFRARVLILDFPGWTAYLDGRPTAITPEPQAGLMGVDVPAGEHTLSIRFEDTPGRLFANSLSLAVALLVVAAVAFRRWRPRPSPDTGARQRPLPLAEGGGEGSGSGPAIAQSEREVDPRPREQPGAEAGLAPRQALGLVGLAFALAVGKAAYVDPHTDWFRAATDLERIPGLERRLDADFGGDVSLLGYAVDRKVGAPGDTVRVTLFWRALRPVERNHAVFVHLGDDENDKLAQQDKPHPAGVPIRAWQPGQFARDEHVLRLPEDMPPGIFQFRVGLYDQQTIERLSVVGSPHNFVSLLEPFRVGGPPPQAATAASYAVGEAIRLVGYRIVNPTVRPGEAVKVHLYWEALAPSERDLTVFVHLYDDAGQLRGTGDRQPLGGQYPTSRWLVGEVVGDAKAVTLDPQAPPGTYRLAVGLYDLQTMQRLPVRGERQAGCPENAVCLAPAVEAVAP